MSAYREIMVLLGAGARFTPSEARTLSSAIQGRATLVEADEEKPDLDLKAPDYIRLTEGYDPDDV